MVEGGWKGNDRTKQQTQVVRTTVVRKGGLSLFLSSPSHQEEPLPETFEVPVAVGVVDRRLGDVVAGLRFDGNPDGAKKLFYAIKALKASSRSGAEAVLFSTLGKTNLPKLY